MKPATGHHLLFVVLLIVVPSTAVFAQCEGGPPYMACAGGQPVCRDGIWGAPPEPKGTPCWSLPGGMGYAGTCSGGTRIGAPPDPGICVQNPPPTPTYSVGGTITGPASCKATLKLNEGSALTAGDGAYVFSEKLPSGSFQVELTGQSAGCSCEFASGGSTFNGALHDANVGDVNVNCNALPKPGSVQGKFWVVPFLAASKVSFPAPSSTPDAIFTTNGIAYIAQSPANCETVSEFLSTCSTAAIGLTFSGASNAALGGPVGPETMMNSTKYGEIIEFTGSASLQRDEEIYILHDDGVSLKIDGQPFGDYNNGISLPILEHKRFTGTSGTHTFDLLYGNVAESETGDGAWLLFFPQLF
jgi:hypothetical protein